MILYNYNHEALFLHSVQNDYAGSNSALPYFQLSYSFFSLIFQELCSVVKPVMFNMLMGYFQATSQMSRDMAIFWCVALFLMNCWTACLQSHVEYLLMTNGEMWQTGLSTLLYEKVCVTFVVSRAPSYAMNL